MKNKSLPAVFAIVLLLILSCLTVVFVADYYSIFGDQFSDTIYETNGISPLYGTKALDTESVQFRIAREEALAIYKAASLEDLDYWLAMYPPPGTIAPDSAGQTAGDPVSADQADREPDIIYVVYSESLIKSGGF